MLYNEYEPFNFMVVILFVYFVLLLFIVIIIYNINHSKDITPISLEKQCPGGTANTNGKCIPAPTPIPRSKNKNSLY